MEDKHETIPCLKIFSGHINLIQSAIHCESDCNTRRYSHRPGIRYPEVCLGRGNQRIFDWRSIFSFTEEGQDLNTTPHIHDGTSNHLTKTLLYQFMIFPGLFVRHSFPQCFEQRQTALEIPVMPGLVGQS